MLIKSSLVNVAVAVCAFLCVETPASEITGKSQAERLRDGEVIVSILDRDMPGGSAKVEALFHSSSDTVWDVIGQCKFEFIYIKGLQECEVLQPGDSHMILRHKLRNSWYTPTLDFTFNATRSKDGRGEANLLEGNLKMFRGSWVLTNVDSGNAVHVSHEISVQPRFPVPRWLIRRSLTKDLPDMLACIRGLAEASGGQAQKAADLLRCPGEVEVLSE